MILNLSVTQLKEQLATGEISPAQVLDAYYKEIETRQPKIDAYLTLFKERAYAKAKKLEEKIKSKKPLGSLAGTPVSVKDNILIEGFPTTCASKILQNYQASYNATVVDRLEASDALIVGKTNLDEFAMGSSTENSGFKTTKNPWDLARVPGGSSGGSAASVAAGMALVSLGSDTGGSIRQPASFCGLVGFKPTYGAVSRFGLVAYASSLDQIGPLARDADDAKQVFDAISGHDPKDSTSLPNEVGRGERKEGSRKPKLGIPKEYFESEGLDPEVKIAVQNGIEVFKSEGYEIREVTLPHTKYALPTYYILAPSEASANLARYDGIRYGSRVGGLGYRVEGQKDSELIQMYKATRTQGFGPEVQRRILIGTFALSHGYYDAYYGKAQTARNLISEDFNNAFKEVSVILAPTAPTPAFKIGEKSQDPIAMYLSDIFTIPVNLAGIPAISVPCGFSAPGGLPIGLQIIGPRLGDPMLFDLAKLFEKATSRQFIKRPEVP